MDINKKIEEIKQEPEHIRMRYAIMLSASSVFILFLFWIISFKGSINNYDGPKENASKCSAIQGLCDSPDEYQSNDPLDNLPKSIDNITKQKNSTE
ncbi:hypothetical protein ACFL3M_02535 [Patescibacteria group bacterium]